MQLPPIVLEFFHRNGLVNAALLEHLTPDDLMLSDGQGGLSIGQHLEHLFGVRRYWVGKVAPTSAERIEHSTLEGNNRHWDVTLDLQSLKAAFEEGDLAALEAVQDAYRENRKFAGVYESDPSHLLFHAVVHDAHHRGQVMTLLRQHGRPLEQMDEIDGATWPIWKQ